MMGIVAVGSVRALISLNTLCDEGQQEVISVAVVMSLVLSIRSILSPQQHAMDRAVGVSGVAGRFKSAACSRLH